MTVRSAYYFISDLHLESTYQTLISGFEQFLQIAKKDAQAIYILGDFFNSWIGDDDNSAFISHISHLLRELNNAGIEVYFMHGNRDFLLGEKFAAQASMRLIPEGSIVSLFGRRTILLHGDSLCIDDENYQAFRRKVRDPRWQKKVLSYPLWLRKILARYYRWRSQKANQNKAEYIMDVNDSAVEEVFLASQAQLMIHGHTHRPARHSYTIDNSACERIVLGDWGEKMWYLKVDETDVELFNQKIVV